MRKMHSDEYDEAHFRKTRSIVGVWLTTMRPLWWRWVKIIRKYKPSGRLLDVGCGEGYFLQYAETYYETYGMDVSEYCIHVAQQKATKTKLSLGSIEHIDYNNENFDIVTCFDVLEHLKYPEMAIKECKRVLCKGGIFAIRVPNTSSFGCRWKKEAWFAYKDKTHASLLSNEEWFRIFRENNLEILNVFHDGLWDTPYVRYIPKFLQDCLIKFPSLGLFLLGIPQKHGESLCIISRRG